MPSGQSDDWRVFLRQQDPAGRTYWLPFQMCPGETDDQAIDYALERIGELVEGWTITAAYAVRESAIGPTKQVVPVRRAAFKRRKS